jgi:hypothetical protein
MLYAKFMVDEAAVGPIFLWDSSVSPCFLLIYHELLSYEIAMVRHHNITFSFLRNFNIDMAFVSIAV